MVFCLNVIVNFRQKLLFLILASQACAKSPLTFNKDIRPILSDKCFACHGFDEETREAKLRLDIPEGAFKKKKRGKPAIVAGKPDESESWLRIITKDQDDVMPPPDSHKHLLPSFPIPSSATPLTSPANIKSETQLWPVKP